MTVYELAVRLKKKKTGHGLLPEILPRAPKLAKADGPSKLMTTIFLFLPLNLVGEAAGV